MLLHPFLFVFLYERLCKQPVDCIGLPWFQASFASVVPAILVKATLQMSNSVECFFFPVIFVVWIRKSWMIDDDIADAAPLSLSFSSLWHSIQLPLKKNNNNKTQQL